MANLRVDDSTFEIAGYRFGFADRVVINNGVATQVSIAEAGPLGAYRIPVTGDAAQGILLAILLLVIGAVGLIWIRKRPSDQFSSG